MKKDIAWNKVGKTWRLVTFQENPAPSWDKYLKNQEEYWGEDRISGSRSFDWQWKGNRDKWLELMLKEYENYVAHCTKWNGKFKKGETIPILHTEKNNVLKLCVIKNNETTWHDTLELWLFKEFQVFPPSNKLKTEIYTFSTTVDKKGNPCNSWLKGEYDTQIVPNSKVTIGDAVFEIIHI